MLGYTKNMPRSTQKPKVENTLVIYQSKSGALKLRGDLSNETLWATQAQIVTLY